MNKAESAIENLINGNLTTARTLATGISYTLLQHTARHPLNLSTERSHAAARYLTAREDDRPAAWQAWCDSAPTGVQENPPEYKEPKPRYLNANWQMEVENILNEILPHGSGINCKWEYLWVSTQLICRNSFHCMNSDGMYDGFADFSIRLKYNHQGNAGEAFRLMFHGREAQRLNTRYQLGAYLVDMFYEALEKFDYLSESFR